MLGKLFGRLQGQRSNHPLGSRENLDETLGAIPRANPERCLIEIDHHLGQVQPDLAEIGAAAAWRATLALDEAAEPARAELLNRYLREGTRDYLSDALWSVLDTHQRNLLEAYRACLPAVPAELSKAALAKSLVCALHAWRSKLKLLRFRYRQAGEELWRVGYELIRSAETQGLTQVAQAPAGGTAETTPLLEYLAAVYLELAPLSNLNAPQVEVIARLLGRVGSLEYAPHPRESSTHFIELAGTCGPRRLPQGDPPPGGGRGFLSVTRARSAVMLLTREALKGGKRPDFLAELSLGGDAFNAAIGVLIDQWGSAPPHRACERVEAAHELRAVFGFLMARRVVGFSAFARSGRSFEYEGSDWHKHFERRFGRVSSSREGPAEIAPPVVAMGGKIATPQEVLARLESAGDHLQMESWHQLDSSATGIGAQIPGIMQQRHVIGGMVAMRYDDGLEWRIGIVRRIGRSANGKPNLGIETLPWPSVIAEARPDVDANSWAKAVDGGAGWTDAVLVSADSDEVLLPAGQFADGSVIRLRAEEAGGRLRLTALLERGPDFERHRFERLEEDSI